MPQALQSHNSSRKIIIMGDSGRGKSTLASKISEKLGVPHFSTDDFLYKIKFSVYKERQEAAAGIAEVYKQDAWVVEGATHFLLKPGLELADLIIYLKYSNIFSQWASIIKRSFGRKDEKLSRTLWLLWHVLYKKFQTKSSRLRKGQMTDAERLAPYRGKVVELPSFKEIDAFLASL